MRRSRPVSACTQPGLWLSKIHPVQGSLLRNRSYDTFISTVSKIISAKAVDSPLGLLCFSLEHGCCLGRLDSPTSLLLLLRLESSFSLLFLFGCRVLAQRSTSDGISTERDNLFSDSLGVFVILPTKSEIAGRDELRDLDDGLASIGARVETFTVINLALNLFLLTLAAYSIPTANKDDSRWS